MNRRAFIGIFGAGIASLAGCASLGQLQNSNDSSQAIQDQQFRLVDYDERVKSNDSEQDMEFQHAANVSFEADTNRVTITGQLLSGGRSCKETVLDSAKYDEEDETLTVEVLDIQESDQDCTLEIAIVPYEATVTLKSELPETVIVKHREDGDGVVYEQSFEQT